MGRLLVQDGVEGDGGLAGLAASATRLSTSGPASALRLGTVVLELMPVLRVVEASA
jgi:hypothetical protein